ncbi:MAG: hypothetical protein H7833_15590 [Magnetococcus sp. DMHC-1]
MGSLRLTVGILSLVVAGAWYVMATGASPTWVLLVPFTLFAINLGVALAMTPALRQQTALFVFHLALLGLVGLVMVGRLTYLKGVVEITTGTFFEGTLLQEEKGPWHPGTLAGIRWRNIGFEIDYAPGLTRGKTRNQVEWWDGMQWQQLTMGDDQPLVISGYRFYTTSNKGFVPLFVWKPTGEGEVGAGGVHLPGYPAALVPISTWTIPGTTVTGEIELRLEEKLADPERAWQLRLPVAHHLILAMPGGTHTLRPGEHVDLPEGRLLYQGLQLWMGYRVLYDETRPWLLAAALLASISLALHFWQKFVSQ